eukprot:TRINITY_DN16397_c0_g2_i1.p1 TRINITY_DN16397_c0_g2~~TRINITY_DN16397_c0_g2_i1.p1  ORF type:complete len:1206 (+),score=371.92 TRINITY_DN16397_c0_g2_i1:523-4140(+)
MASLGFMSYGSLGHLQAWAYAHKDKDRLPKFNLKRFSNLNFITAGCTASKTYVIAEASHVIELDKRGNAAKWVHGLTSADRLQEIVLTTATISEQYICVGASDGKVNVFSTATLAFMAKIPAPSPTPITAMVFDRRYLHIINMDKSTYHYEIELQPDSASATTTFLASRSMHGTAVWGMQPIYLDDGGIKLASCSEDGKVQIWSVAGEGNNKVRSFQVKGASLRSLTANVSNTLAVGDKEGSITLLDIVNEMFVVTSCAAHDSDVVTMTFGPPCSPDLLVSGGRDGMVHLLKATNSELQVLLSFNPHTDAITSVTLQPVNKDGKLLLVSSSTDGNIVYQPITLEGEVADEPTVYATKSPILSTAMYPRGTILLSVGKNDFLSCRQMTLPLGQVRRQYRIPSEGKGHYMVKIEPGAEWVAVAGYNGSIKIVDYFSGTIVAQTPNTGAQPTVMSWVVSSGKLQLVVGDAEGCLYVWKFSAASASKIVEAGGGAKPAIPRALAPPAPVPVPAPAPADPTPAPAEVKPKPAEEIKGDPRGPMFTSGVLRGNVGGKWHGQAYQAFVEDNLNFPQMDNISTAGSFKPLDDSDDDEDDGNEIPLSKRSICATKDIESLWNKDKPVLSGSLLRTSVTAQWRKIHKPVDPHPSTVHHDPTREAPVDAHPSMTVEAHIDPNDLLEPKTSGIVDKNAERKEAEERAKVEWQRKADERRKAEQVRDDQEAREHQQNKESERNREQAEDKSCAPGHVIRENANNKWLGDRQAFEGLSFPPIASQPITQEHIDPVPITLNVPISEEREEQLMEKIRRETEEKEQLEREKALEEQQRQEAEETAQQEEFEKRQQELIKQQENARKQREREKELARKQEQELREKEDLARQELEMQEEELKRQQLELAKQAVELLIGREQHQREALMMREEMLMSGLMEDEELAKKQEEERGRLRKEEEENNERRRIQEEEDQRTKLLEEAAKKERLKKKFDEVKTMAEQNKKVNDERQRKQEKERKAMEVIDEIEQAATPTKAPSDGEDTADEGDLTKSVVKQRLQDEREAWKKNKSQLDSSTGTIPKSEEDILDDTCTSRMSKGIVYPQNCRKGLDKMVEGMQQVFESMEAEGSPPDESLVSTFPPPRRVKLPEDDATSVLHWMRNSIDALLNEEPASPVPSSPQADPALEDRLAVLESQLTLRLTKRWETEMNDFKKMVISKQPDDPK